MKGLFFACRFLIYVTFLKDDLYKRSYQVGEIYAKESECVERESLLRWLINFPGP